MAKCTCGWDNDPTWCHANDCPYRLEQETLAKPRFITLRVSLKEPRTKADADTLARQIAGNISDNAGEVDLPEWSNVDEVYWNTVEGDGNDLGM